MKRVWMRTMIVCVALGGLVGCSDDTSNPTTDTKPWPTVDKGPSGDKPAVNKEKGTTDTTSVNKEKGTTDTGSACIPKTTGGPTAMGTGGGCINSGCHNAPVKSLAAFTAAGTVYGAASGTTGVSGVTVEVTDNAGKVVKLVTGSLGNFYTTDSLTAPLKVRVSGCPDDVKMSSTASNGNCNGSGCHVSGNRVHIP
jgi:hypothetical protein